MSERPVVNRFDASLTINHVTESSFTTSGRREFVSYRDLGVEEATNGHAGATISRLANASIEPTGWHYHTCDLQIFYVLQGWLELEFEDGPVRLEAGACVTIPPGVAHNEMNGSPDLETLEVTLPAKMGTVPVPAPNRPAN